MNTDDRLDGFPVARRLYRGDVPDGPLLNAPRPLFGEAVDVDVMGFTVRPPDDDRQLDQNRRLDAHVLVLVTPDDARAETAARLTAEYGAEAVADLDPDDLLGMWRP